jgi:hypothetical protein
MALVIFKTAALNRSAALSSLDSRADSSRPVLRILCNARVTDGSEKSRIGQYATGTPCVENPYNIGRFRSGREWAGPLC